MTCNIEIYQFWQKGNTAYYITDDGRVLSSRVGVLPLGAVSVPADSVGGAFREIASFNGKGYRRVRIQGKNFKVHRLVAEAFVQNPDNLPHVLHLDGDRTNNHHTNLAWSNSQSNHL